MAVAVRSTVALRFRAGAPVSATYSVLGLRIRSALRLPVDETADGVGQPDVVVNAHHSDAPPPKGNEIAFAPCVVHGADMRVHRGASRTWIWSRGCGTAVVANDGSLVDYYIEPGADEDAIGLAVTGPIAVFILHMRGRPSLHASAVVSNGRAVAFVGPAGQGKSTMAAAFLRKGAEFFSDDVLPLQLEQSRIWASAGLPFMKVSAATAKETLAIDRELPALFQHARKNLLRVADEYVLARSPKQIGAIYVLERLQVSLDPSEVTSEVIPRAQALEIFLRHTQHRSFLRPIEQVPLLRVLAQLATETKVRVLRFPTGHEHHEAVVAHVERELGESS
jgi:hypothetical protein